MSLKKTLGVAPLLCAAWFGLWAAQSSMPDDNARRIQALEDAARQDLTRNFAVEGRIARIEANVEAQKAAIDKIDSTLTQLLLGIAALFVGQAVQFFTSREKRTNASGSSGA